MVRRAERWPATFGERRVKEVTPLAVQWLAVRRALERRDPRTAGHELAR